VVGKQEVAVLPSVVKVRKGDMVWVLARMPIDFYQYEMTRARKDQKIVRRKATEVSTWIFALSEEVVTSVLFSSFGNI